VSDDDREPLLRCHVRRDAENTADGISLVVRPVSTLTLWLVQKTSPHVASLRAGLTLMTPAVVGNVGDNSVSNYRLMHLKHNSWPTPHPSVICVELLGGSRQPMTGRLAARPSNRAVKRQIRVAVHQELTQVQRSRGGGTWHAHHLSLGLFVKFRLKLLSRSSVFATRTTATCIGGLYKPLLLVSGVGVLRRAGLSVCVSLSVCLSGREHISLETLGPELRQIFCAHVTCGHGSVLLWRRCDT